MATKPLTLSGLVEPVANAAGNGILRELRIEKQRLEEETLRLRRELDDAHLQNEKLERSLRTLRKQLSPLHHALRAVFGEIELAVGEEEFAAAPASANSPSQPSSGSDARWESYKNTFPGVGAKIIDALLSHEEMNYVQLGALLKHSYDTIKGAAAKLMKAGALKRNGKAVRLNR